MTATNKRTTRSWEQVDITRKRKEEIYHRLADNYKKALQNLRHFTDSEMVLVLGRAIKESRK